MPDVVDRFGVGQPVPNPSPAAALPQNSATTQLPQSAAPVDRFGVGGVPEPVTDAPLPFDESRTEFIGSGGFLDQLTDFENAGRNVRAGITKAFTLNPERRAAAFKKLFPEAQFQHDDKGNLLITMPGSGRGTEFVNEPGLDASDLATVISQIGSFLPAARAASLPASLGGRMAAGGAAAGATDAAMQGVVAAQGGGPVDLRQTALVAGTGGAAELIAPVVGPLVQRLTPQAGAAQASAELGREGIEAAAEILPQQVIQGSAPGFAQSAARQPAQSGVLAAEREFLSDSPAQLTRGQRTGDATQQAIENDLRVSGRPGSQLLIDQADTLDNALAGANDSLQAQVGQSSARGLQDLGQEIAEGVASGARRARSRTSALYDQVELRAGDVTLNSPDTLRELVRRQKLTLANVRQGGTPVSSETTPQLQQAANALNSLERILRTSDAVKAPTLRRVESMRKRLNTYIDTAKPGSPDARALMQLKRSFDGWLDEVIEGGLMSGDREVVQVLRDARMARAVQGRLYENVRFPGGRGVDKEVSRIMQRLASPTSGSAATAGEALNLIFGFGRLGGKTSSVKTLRHLRTVFGPDSVEFGALRQAAIARLWQSSLRNLETGGGFSRKTLASALNDALDGPGGEMMAVLFNRTERAQLNRFRQLVNATVPRPGTTNLSGTAASWTRQFGRLVPWGAGILSGVAAGNGDLSDSAAVAVAVSAIMGRVIPYRQAVRATAANTGAGAQAVTRSPSAVAGSTAVTDEVAGVGQ